MKRIGIIGAGLMGNFHAARWQHLPVHLSGIYDPDQTNAQTTASTHNTRAYNNLNDLLANSDIIDICTPTHTHKNLVLTASNAGKTIICEKPLARTISDAQHMIRTCKQNQTPLYVGHVVRFFQQYTTAKHAQDNGQLGSPGVIRLIRAGSFPRDTPDSWYNNFHHSGGVIMDLSIHDLDYARWCYGEIERIHARGLTFSNTPMRDHCLITLKFKNGALGHIEGSWANPPTTFRTALELSGSNGIIEWDSLDATPVQTTLSMNADNAKVPQTADSPLADEDDPYLLELAHFLDCILHDTTPRVTTHDALMALTLSLAAIESVKTGMPVNIDAFMQQHEVTHA